MAVADPPAVALPPLAEARVVVVHVPEQRRFEVRVGGRRAGFTEYFETGDRRVFVHTEVGQAFSGRGLASAVVRRALEATREDGRRAAAVCPYVSRWLASHPGFEDLVAPGR
ncbi:GNAT family N-acetyltransferase [Quadrisphaera sp. KR29]|uniref:GNAT family N-acetyltransferase n=1 Tax=Quadrisphaera sp. KR29 TaxID=3461391 RepID=UPI0040442D5F